MKITKEKTGNKGRREISKIQEQLMTNPVHKALYRLIAFNKIFHKVVCRVTTMLRVLWPTYVDSKSNLNKEDVKGRLNSLTQKET